MPKRIRGGGKIIKPAQTRYRTTGRWLVNKLKAIHRAHNAPEEKERQIRAAKHKADNYRPNSARQAQTDQK